MFIDELNRLHIETKEFVERTRKEPGGTLTMTLTPKTPELLDTVVEKFKTYLINNL